MGEVNGFVKRVCSGGPDYCLCTRNGNGWVPGPVRVMPLGPDLGSSRQPARDFGQEVRKVDEYRWRKNPSQLSFFGMMLIAAFMGGLLVLLAVKFTGLGRYLVYYPPVQEDPGSVPQELPMMEITDFETATIRVVEKVGPA